MAKSLAGVALVLGLMLVVGFTVPYFIGPRPYSSNFVTPLTANESFSKLLNLGSGDMVQGTFSPNSFKINFLIIDPNGTTVLSFPDISQTKSFNFTAAISGNYSLVAYNANPSSVLYNLVFTVQPKGSWTYSWLTPIMIMAPALVFGGVFDGLQVRTGERALSIKDKVSSVSQILFIVAEIYTLAFTPQLAGRISFAIVSWFLLALFVTITSLFIGNPSSGRSFAILGCVLWLFINTGILLDWGYLLGLGFVSFQVLFQYVIGLVFLVAALVPLLLHRE